MNDSDNTGESSRSWVEYLRGLQAPLNNATSPDCARDH